MQKEKNFFLKNYNAFEHNHDFETVFWKSDDALLVFGVLDKNVFI